VLREITNPRVVLDSVKDAGKMSANAACVSDPVEMHKPIVRGRF
jgi:hypothetical protein